MPCIKLCEWDLYLSKYPNLVQLHNRFHCIYSDNEALSCKNTQIRRKGQEGNKKTYSEKSQASLRHHTKMSNRLVDC